MYHSRIIFVILLAITTNAFAQKQSNSAALRVERWIDSTLAADPLKRELARRADSYERALQLEAATKLGISFEELFTKVENDRIQSLPIADTGNTKNVSKNSTYDQNETSIAINRKNPSIVVAGANSEAMSIQGMPIYYTTNAGTSWRTGLVPYESIYQPLGDPALASSVDGTMYYAYLMAQSFDVNTNFYLDNLVVSTSVNGRTWTQGKYVIPIDEIKGFEDKEQITVDNNPSSPYFGRVYLVWLHFFSIQPNDLRAEVRLVYSTDKALTWSKTIVIDTVEGEFSQVHTGKNGEVVITFSVQANEQSSGGEHRMYVSTDGAKHFTRKHISNFVSFPLNIQSRQSLKNADELGLRAFPYITFDLNLKTNLIHLVYGSWYSAGKAAMLFYITSSDLGSSWSKPVAIGYGPDGPTPITARDRFCPWLTVNQITDEAQLTYYSSEFDQFNLQITAVRTSLNNAAADSLRTLDPGGFDPFQLVQLGQLPFIGDYIGSDAYDTVYAAAWAHVLDQDLDAEVYVYLGLPIHSKNGVGSARLVHSDRLRLASVFPNPVIDHTVQFEYYSPSDSKARLEMIDTRGNTLATIWNGTLIEGSSIETIQLPPSFSSGTYFLRLITDDESDEIKVVVK